MIFYGQFIDFMDESFVEIQKKNFQNYSYQLKVIKNVSQWDLKFDKSAIIFCERIGQFFG